MRCKKCNSRLAEHDIWCVSCGTQSPVLKTELSALKSLRQTRESLRNKISEMVPASSFSIIFGVIPIAVLTWVFHNYIHTEGTLQMLTNLGIKAILFSIFVPFIIMPFRVVSTEENYQLKLNDLIGNLSSYPRYLLFSLISSLYFVIIHLICFGFPGFASDPILRLVWIVLINYWAAIVAPAPVIMERRHVSAWRAIVLSYRHFHDLRWNIYLLVFVLGIMNLIAFGLAIFPLLLTLPLSFFAIRDYTILLESYDLLDYRI